MKHRTARMSVSLLFFCLLAVSHVVGRFFSGRVVPPGRNEYLNSRGAAAAVAWSPEEAVGQCEGDPECAGFTIRGPLRSGEKRHVAFFR